MKKNTRLPTQPSITHHVSKAYLKHLRRCGIEDTKLCLQIFANLILEYVVIEDDNGARFFKDNLITCRSRGLESNTALSFEKSYQILACQSHAVLLVDEVFVTPDSLNVDVEFDDKLQETALVTPQWNSGNFISEPIRTVVDKRGIAWEMFSDVSYFDMIAVKPVEEHDINSPLVFHFINKETADQFLTLIQLAS